jgi:hypothetical protein
MFDHIIEYEKEIFFQKVLKMTMYVVKEGNEACSAMRNKIIQCIQ